MKKILLTALRLVTALTITVTSTQAASTIKAEKYDIVIYGGSPSGLSAAIQAARLGSRAISWIPTATSEE